MADKKTWTKKEILEMWPQAKEELQGFQRHLERNAGITASQLGMALQLAEAEFKRLLRLLPKICKNCKEETDTIEVVDEIIDRFEVIKVRVCPKCAKKIRKENSMLAN